MTNMVFPSNKNLKAMGLRDSSDEVERLRCALSLALQFVPLESQCPDQQADISLIHDLVAGRAVPWDELDRISRRDRLQHPNGVRTPE